MSLGSFVTLSLIFIVGVTSSLENLPSIDQTVAVNRKRSVISLIVETKMLQNRQEERAHTRSDYMNNILLQYKYVTVIQNFNIQYDTNCSCKIVVDNILKLIFVTNSTSGL
jgi:hypothetical protein